MTLKALAMAAAALIAAAALYRAGEIGLWRRWLTPEPPPKPIVFDNGTVREMAPTAAPALPQAPPGPVTKCRRGAEIVYTNGGCPPGSREQPLQGGTFNVVGVGGAAAAPAPRAAASARPPTVRDLVDTSDVERLKERRIEEALRR